MSDWVEALSSASRSRDYSSATRTVQLILDRLDDDLTSFEIDTIVYNLFSNKSNSENPKTLVSIIKKVFIDVSSDAFVCSGLDLILKFVDGNPKGFDKYLGEIISVCLTILRSACKVRVKEKCFPILNAVVGSSQSTFIPSIVDVMMKQIMKKTEKPTIIAKEYELIGMICKTYPELVDSETFGRSYLQTLEEHLNGKVKISFPLLEGCFNGLAGFLIHFFDPYMGNIIYDAVKKFSNPGEQLRRGHARAALRIIAEHGKYFKSFLLCDFKYWHLLLLKWINQSNSDDKKIGYTTLFSYYNNIGDELFTLGVSDKTLLSLEYFITYFKQVLSEKLNSNADVCLISDTYEVKYALKGFTTLVSKCKSYFKADEIHNLTSMITQRALLLYKENRVEDISVTKDATEESTEKIEELCNHIEALAAIGINTNKNLESLVCILITDFPKCKPHRRFIVRSAFKQALKIMEIQIIVSYFIEESCKHCISSSLYYGSETLHFPISYCTFMPLWKDILELKSEMSNQIYDELIEWVLKTIPTLDLSTQLITDNSNLQHEDSEIEALYLETFEKPLMFSDYRMFYNLCDFTASIMAFQWTYEWSYRWIEPFIALLIKGRKKYSNAIGFLRIGEIILMMIKKRYADNIVTLDIQKNILKLLNDLPIQDSSGMFQLRAALMFLQAPPCIIDASLLVKSIDAFKVIFRAGKSNLSLVSGALEILEEWNSEIDREEFRPLCVGILPGLNDYLCSSGVSDINVLEKGSSVISHNLKKKYQLRELMNPELALLQHRIILFMGKMDSLTVQPLLKTSVITIDYNSNEECNNSLYGVEKLKISLPCFQQQKLELYLDLLVPRINELALNSTNRDTRLTACQTLHSIILIVYGTRVTLPPSQKSHLTSMQTEIFMAMLHLAADPDTCISNMFAPLLKQSSNWLSNPHQKFNDTSCFLSVLMKGACHPTNSSIQDISCQIINEFISRTIEKSNANELMEVPLNISVILRSVCQMMVYPDSNQSRGAFLILDCAINQLYRLDPAVDKYLLDLLHSVIKSLESFSDKNDALGLKVLDKILKCLELKFYLFEKPNKNRRIPQSFDNVMLDDICLWLLSQGKNVSRNVTRKCFQTFLFIFKKSKFDRKKFIYNLTEDFAETNRKCFEWENILCTKNDNFSHFTNSLENLYNTVDNYSFLLKNHECFHNMLSMIETDNFCVLKGIQLILKLTTENCIEKLSQKMNFNLNDMSQKSKFENSIIRTLWRTYNIILLFSTSNYKVLKSFSEEISNDFILSFSKLILDPYAMNIANNNDEFSTKDYVKQLIDNFKLSMNEKWPILEKTLVNGLMIHQALDIHKDNFLLDSKQARILTLYLNTVRNIINSFDDNKKKKLLNLYSSPDNLKKIFNYLFLTTSEYDRTLVNCFDKIISFSLQMNSNISKDLMEIITNETVITNTNVKYLLLQNQIVCGKHFYKQFEAHIVMYIKNNSLECFDFILNNVCESNKNNYINLTQTIMKSLINIENDEKLVECWQNLIKMFNNLWPRFINWKISLDDLLLLFSLIITLPPSKKIFEYGENNISLWLLDCLNDMNIELKNKPFIITLIPSILQPGIKKLWYHDLLSVGLENIRESLPSSCHEFAPFTKDQSEYINIIKASLKAMANSGSYAVFDFVLKCTIADSEHICEEQINYNIKLFFDLLSIDEQLDSLKEVYKLVPSLSANMLLNFTKRFLVPLLLQSSPYALEEFLIEIIPSIFTILDKQLALNLSSFQNDRIFVEWFTAYRIIEIMFIKIAFENIDSEDSKIAISYYKEPPPRQKFVNEINTKAFQFRNTEIPPRNISEFSSEFLRQAHCAAYKCIYTITITRPQSDYMILLNHKMGPSMRMWEGMIDVNKKYIFSMVSNHELKKKHCLIPTTIKTGDTRMIGFRESLINFTQTSTTNTIDQRQNLLSQTLKEDILKFDLNTSLIRNSSQEFTRISQNANSGQSSWALNDDDLNNHECMGIICQIIQDLYELTKDAKETVPEWMKCIIEILSDKNRKNNIRLFFSQVVDNVDIFEKYANQMFLPMLSIIQDRCTGFDSSLNHQDFCLLSLLLSWSDVVRPMSEDEILSASSILHFIIEEIYSHSHRNQCFELLKSILSTWGSYLLIPYDLIIVKLECDTNRIISFQIVEIFLTQDIPTWNEMTLEKYQELLLNLMKLDDKTVYNLVSRVAGLTLKLLSKSDRALPFEIKIKTVIESFTQGKNEKFVLCLYNIQNHYGFITDESIISKVSYLLPQFPVNFKKKCLEIFLCSMECIPKENLFRELASLKLDDFIKDKDFRITSLRIINKSLNHLEIPQIDSIMKDINFLCDLTNSKDKECREATYDVLMNLFTIFEKQSQDLKSGKKCSLPLRFGKIASTSRKRSFEVSFDSSKMNLKNNDSKFAKNLKIAKVALLSGIDDDDTSLKEKIYKFWNEKFSHDSIQDRWANISLEFFVNGCSGKPHLLGQLVRIILGGCNSDLDHKMIQCFENPLEDCIFEDYDWKVSNKNQNNSTLPLLAETLNSQLIISNVIKQSQRGQIVSNRDMKTLNSILNSKSFTKPNELILRNSIQSFSETFVENNAYLRNTMSDTFVQPEKQQKDNLRKKIIDSKTQKNIKFSEISVYKAKSKMAKKLNEKPLQSYKRFRTGEYPDIQIFLTDILSPLMELTACDLILAKDIFIILFKCISKHSLLTSNKEFTVCDISEDPISIKKFNSIALNIAISCLKNHELETSVGECLLEICRLSLDDYEEIEEFDQTINNTAKFCDIQWLGKLILEEKNLKTPSMAPKRLKYAMSKDKYLDRIYKFESTKNYCELQKIYAEAAVDNDTSNDMKISYTENFFQSFSQLSDWDGFIEQMNYQFSSNDDSEPSLSNSFDYNSLWSKTWMKNSLLSLTFNANIHRLADMTNFDNSNRDSLIADLSKFGTLVDNWISDPEKNQYMNTYLPIQLALWKTAYGKDGLFFVKSAMEWVKNRWMQVYTNSECVDREENNRDLIFSNLQMIGEFCSILETPLFSGSDSNLNVDIFKKKLNKIINIWKCCNPNTYDQVPLWNLRLSSRSIFVSRLQKMTEEYVMHESDDSNMLSKIQRASELCLVKAAVANLNSSIGKKLVNKQLNNLETDEEVSWGLQWALINKVNAMYEVELKCKLDSLLLAWKLSENLRSNFVVDEDPKSYIELLTNSASISYEIFKTVNEFNEEGNTFCGASLYSKVSDIFVISKFVITGVENVSLIKYGKKHLEDAIVIVENNLIEALKNPAAKYAEFISDTHLTMAKFCKNVIENKELTEDLNLLPNLVRSLLKSMIYGNIEACKIFPILLTKFEKLNENHEAFNIFKTEAINIPSWMFLPWVSQLLAHFPTLHDILSDLIKKISVDFPQSMVHQYRLSKRIWKLAQCFATSKMNNMTNFLDEKLLDDNIEMLIEALSSVCDPNILLKTHLENIIRSTENRDNSVSFQMAFNDLFEEVFPNDIDIKSIVRGPIFKQIESFKPICEKIWKEYQVNNNIHEAQNKIINILKQSNLEQRGNISRHKAINDFSPFLYKFDSFLSRVPIHIFGQCNTFERSKMEKCIFITKFSNEVSAIGLSLRRPIRITIIGSDGKKYPFLVKRGEDLRQDERIQQLFDLMNNLLNKYSMKISTYKVVPLTWDCGVIEWLNNHATLKDIIYKYDTNIEALMLSLKNSRINYVSSLLGNTMAEKYANLAVDIHKSVSSYNELVQQVPKYLLRDAIFKLAVSPEKFVRMRNNYVHSLAAMNISHWILGIGDRHLANCLLNIKTGNFLGIDFGYAFGTATQLLSMPELIPFRLTPQIVNVLAPCGIEDKLRQLMIQTLDCFKENADLLIATLEVFVFEPTLNWIHHFLGEKPQLGSDSDMINTELNHWSPQVKVNQCKLKLSNGIPLKIIIEDLENATNNNFKKIYQSLVKETYKPYKSFLTSSDINTAQQVDCLLNQAIDENLLAVTYFGWEPWA